MKHKKEAVTALVCMIIIAAFVIGMRAGLHDAEVKSMAEMQHLTAQYETVIDNLNLALEQEREVEHVVIEYEYVPMPVDYEVATEITETELTMLAQMAYGEDTLIDVRPEAVAATMETVYNRVDSENPYYPDTVAGVITQPNAYQGYNKNVPVDYRYYLLAQDVTLRHQLKLLGVGDCGYTIPENCVSFSSRGDNVNHFFVNGEEWDWSLPNPYEEVTFSKEVELK